VNNKTIKKEIINKRQDCKVDTVCGGVLVGGARMNEGDEGEGIWLMGFIYLCEIKI
jgi:hypothetical protein